MKKLPLIMVFAVSMLWISMPGEAIAYAESRTIFQGSAQEAPAKTFTGTVVRSGDSFKLNDSDAKASYILDDTQRASQYEGKKVKVTGTLDSEMQMIHVQSIQTAA